MDVPSAVVATTVVLQPQATALCEARGSAAFLCGREPPGEVVGDSAKVASGATVRDVPGRPNEILGRVLDTKQRAVDFHVAEQEVLGIRVALEWESFRTVL
jgi:hypothetical protein